MTDHPDLTNEQIHLLIQTLRLAPQYRVNTVVMCEPGITVVERDYLLYLLTLAEMANNLWPVDAFPRATQFIESEIPPRHLPVDYRKDVIAYIKDCLNPSLNSHIEIVSYQEEEQEYRNTFQGWCGWVVDLFKRRNP